MSAQTSPWRLLLAGALAALCAAAFLPRAEAQQAGAAELAAAVNKAGRQRMPTQRIVKLYCLIGLDVATAGARVQLAESVALFERQLAELAPLARAAGARRAHEDASRLWPPVRELASAPVQKTRRCGCTRPARRSWRLHWEKPEANRQLFTEDGWMRTGDVGLIDGDGFLYITGRTKEVVIRGGENIYPGEIENVAYRHEAVQEAVVFGVDDPLMGEELALVCFLRPGAALDADGLRRHLSERLAAYKVPKHIAIAKVPLPRNASEKLHKLNVKAAFLAGQYAD